MAKAMCIVVGVDTSEESVAALDWALDLAAERDARVIAVHAIGLLEQGGYRDRPDVVGIVEAATARAGTPDALVELVAEDGAPADVLVRVAEREGCGLLVVGSRGLGRAPRLLGSTSEAVLAHAHFPVLIVPAPAPASE